MWNRGERSRERAPEAQLQVLSGTYAICRLPAGADVTWAGGAFVTVTRAVEEVMPTTVICNDSTIPSGVECDRGWRAMRFVGDFGFGEVEVLASVVNTLAEAQVPVLTAATFETNYVLVKAERFDRIQQMLEEAGHVFVETR